MLWQTVTANLWRALSIVLAALAVAAVVACVFLWAGRVSADARADAAEERKKELEQDIVEVWKAVEAADISAKASQGARSSADQRQADRDARGAKVEGYARSAGNRCTADPDLMRELEAGAGDIRRAEDRLRRIGRAEGQQAKPARAD